MPPPAEKKPILLRPPWHLTLEMLIKHDRTPSPWTILSLEVQHSYWDVLAYEHDGLTEQAAEAREVFNHSVEQLRDAFDTHPGLGVRAADCVTGEAIEEARADFAAALRREGQPRLFGEGTFDWRARRGQPRAYF